MTYSKNIVKIALLVTSVAASVMAQSVTLVKNATNDVCSQAVNFTNPSNTYAGTVEEAPNDGNAYYRKNVGWEQVVSVAAPLTDVLGAGNDGGGQSMTNLGAVSATSFAGDGSGLTNVNAATLEGKTVNEIVALGVTNTQTSVRLNTMAIHNGFEDQNAQTVTFDPVTRTATVTPTGASFKVTAGGVTRTYTNALTSSAGPDVSGNMFAYFSPVDGSFVCTNAAWTITAGEAQAIYALYDHSNTSVVYSIDERHGVNISDSDHLMRHQTVGSTWASGITISHYGADTATAASSTGSNTVIAITDSGVFWDEDVRHTSVANGTTAASTNTAGQFLIIWKDATTWHRDAGTPFPFLWTGDTPQYVTSAGTKTVVPEDNYFVYWMLVVGSPNGTNLLLASHPAVYASTAAAQTGATLANMSELLGGFPNSEIMVAYRMIFQHNATAPNANPAAVKGTKLRYVDDYRNVPGGVILAGVGAGSGAYELTEAKIIAAGGVVASDATYMATVAAASTNGATWPAAITVSGPTWTVDYTNLMQSVIFTNAITNIVFQTLTNTQTRLVECKIAGATNVTYAPTGLWVREPSWTNANVHVVFSWSLGTVSASMDKESN